jgi:hypothetical protein
MPVANMAKKAGGGGDEAKVDLYDCLVNEPRMEPTKPGEAPQWFVDAFHDWREKKGEVSASLSSRSRPRPL